MEITTYETAGGNTWTWPSGETQALAILIGGGGAGGSSVSGEGGGGGGEYTRKLVTKTAATATVTVGAGGASAGSAGSSSTFVQSAATHASAAGGSGGSGRNGGTGGSGGIADVAYTGGNGGTSAGTSAGGAGGGSSGGDHGVGLAGQANIGAAGGAGGLATHGAGAGANGGDNGVAGTTATENGGGGGGGGAGATAGLGAPGKAIIICPPPGSGTLFSSGSCCDCTLNRLRLPGCAGFLSKRDLRVVASGLATFDVVAEFCAKWEALDNYCQIDYFYPNPGGGFSAQYGVFISLYFEKVLGVWRLKLSYDGGSPQNQYNGSACISPTPLDGINLIGDIDSPDVEDFLCNEVEETTGSGGINLSVTVLH